MVRALRLLPGHRGEPARATDPSWRALFGTLRADEGNSRGFHWMGRVDGMDGRVDVNAARLEELVES